MKVLIIEDEKPALENLIMCVQQADEHITITGTTSSVAKTIQWLKNNSLPDLILMDIELSDGLAFHIFEACTISCPVIFTTAYNKYLTHAFEFNGIDYLLKPVSNTMLSNTIRKYKNLQQHFVNNYSSLMEYLNSPQKQKSRIVVKRGTEFQAIKLDDIAYFFSEHKLAFAVDKDNRKYLCEINSLSELEKTLDTKVFFRVNRKYIINANYIVKFKSIDKSKISLETLVPLDEEIIISQENAAIFKKWISEV